MKTQTRERPTAPVMARIRPSDREKLYALATKNQTTASQLLRVALTRFLEAAAAQEAR